MSPSLRPIKPLTSPQKRERRGSLRVALRIGVSLAAGTMTVHGWVRNLSIGGAFIETPSPLPANARVDMKALMREGDHVVRLAASGWVVRVVPNGMAVQFDSMDLDTRAHVERLVAESEPGGA